MKQGDEHLNAYLLDDPETGLAERRAIEAHLTGCAGCRRSLESYRRARRLIAPQEISLRSNDFVAGIFSRVDEKSDAGLKPLKTRRPWAWPAAVCALFIAFVAITYLVFEGPHASTQDLLAGGDGGAFYEWATASESPSDEDILKVVLEDL